ncbi:MAG TPA: DUF4404 family protein [Gammaproteobacteria bacterium]|jgi:hypothetical protein
MTDKNLHDALAQLRAEIEKLDSVSESDKQRLESLLARIRNTADPEDAETGDDLQDAITENITKFEASHPRLTAIMNDIATTLSNMGI